jgi:hypothetical protein
VSHIRETVEAATDAQRLPHVADGAIVIYQGRPYRLAVGASNCGSTQHWHAEAHADGSPGGDHHHHHGPACENTPRQATLYPAWQFPPRHVHDFTAGACASGTCACGATRADHGPAKGGRRFVAYTMPADDQHPDGWSYERREEAGSR